MPKTARISDVGVGVCCCHPPIPCIPMVGVLVTAASTITVKGQRVSRLTDICLGGCGHPGFMVSSSGTEVSENLKTVRLGDSFSGCFSGSLVTGASNDETGG